MCANAKFFLQHEGLNWSLENSLAYLASENCDFFCCKLPGHVINFRKFNKEISSCEDYHFTLQSASEFPVILQAVQKSPLLQSNYEYCRVFPPTKGNIECFAAP